MTQIITVDQLRQEIGGIHNDNRFAEFITDEMLEAIIDRHTEYFDSRGEEALFSGAVDPLSLIHLAEPIHVEATAGDPVAKATFPIDQVYVKWSFGAFDNNGNVMDYDSRLLHTAQNNPFVTNRYRIIGTQIEALPPDIESMEVYLILRTVMRTALLGGSYKDLGSDGATVNRDIIFDAGEMVRKRLNFAKRVESFEEGKL